ncbi:MAG TPA: alpha-E domain-containing protein [Thermoanaerobaculia bacterium]|nr:alpha-E domain-containing protein [Thermoanaerobaculia bacterium]
MLSRVADSLYWMGRYLERAENVTRLLLVTEDFSTETQGLAEDLAQTAWKDMLAIFPAAQLTRELTPFAPLSVPYLHTFFTDQANAYSILFSIRKARENARSVREALTFEVFLALNEAFRALETYERKGMPDLPAFRDALNATHKGIFAVVGAIEHTCTRDEGWRFLKLGESLERAHCSALVLRTKLPALLAAEARGDAPLYYTQWRTLLRSLSSLENYRRVYGARLEPNLVIGFLLFNPDSPRSLRYGASVVRDYLAAISGPAELTAPARIIGRLHADLRYDDEAQMRRGDFAGLLDRVVGELAKTHDAIATQYFVT